MAIIIFAFWVLCAAVSGDNAAEKGYSQIKWLLAGLFLGPIGVLGAVGLPDKKLRAAVSELA